MEIYRSISLDRAVQNRKAAISRQYRNRYYLSQFHFHWSENDIHGSEHQVDSAVYPLELHLVHIKEGHSAENATAGTIAVLAVPFQISTNGQTLFNLDGAFKKTQLYNSSDEITTYTPSALIPPNYQSFYRYNVVNGRDEGKWGYVHQDAWTGLCKTGKEQSPINIEIELIEGFNSWSEKPYMEGGGLEKRYYLQQFHFHWSETDTHGSEHQVDSAVYPLELHLVHIKEGHSAENATAGTIAVLAVPFQISTNGQTLFNLDGAFKKTQLYNSSDEITTYTPSALIPPNYQSFYRYNGKKRVIAIELEELRHLIESDGKSLLIHNWREPQPINGRTVYLNHPKK
ncbi:hypothetical protein WR25_04856 [Diploscapter pachys]|uniref:Carbonic anhydrase n=1 Tax=Diploscapter pachys TaxID=2018661 RepID=A0A2A2LXX2_9BILA|nr:hypothetical protein WR25_04856 [Diploscapter pachys]